MCVCALLWASGCGVINQLVPQPKSFSSLNQMHCMHATPHACNACMHCFCITSVCLFLISKSLKKSPVAKWCYGPNRQYHLTATTCSVARLPSPHNGPSSLMDKPILSVRVGWLKIDSEQILIQIFIPALWSIKSWVLNVIDVFIDIIRNHSTSAGFWFNWIFVILII